MAIPLNIAHRGGALLWPENSLFAFVSAAKAGFDGAELDVQLTRDDGLAVFHDFRLKPELCREANGRWLDRKRAWPIRTVDLSELRKLDIGRPKPGTFYAVRHRRVTPRDGECIPSLGDVIAAVRGTPNFRLFIELKTSVKDRTLSASPEALAEVLVAELRAANFLSRAVLVGFDWAALTHVKKLAPNAVCWLNTLSRARVPPEAIKNSGGDGWFCPLDRVSASAVRQAHALGLSFGAWTVNRARDLRKLAALGLDAICTDRPDRLQQILESKPRPSLRDGIARRAR